MKSLKDLDEQETGKDQTGGGLALMKQRFQLEDADRRTYLKSSLLAFQHYEEERKQLVKDIKEAREQLRKQKVIVSLIYPLVYDRCSCRNDYTRVFQAHRQ